MKCHSKSLAALVLLSLLTTGTTGYASDLPGYFDWRHTIPTDSSSAITTSILPPVRCQYFYGTCWSFAALGSVETNWNLQLRQAGITNTSAPDFSERYTAWLAYAPTLDNDPATLITNKMSDMPDTPMPELVYQQGGTVHTDIGVLTRYGLALEEQYPYVKNFVNDMKGVDNLVAPSGLVHDLYGYSTAGYPISEAFTAPFYINNAPDYYKELIKSYGALKCNYRSLGSLNEGKEIYNADAVNSNHAVCLVGWDDDYVFKDKTDRSGQPLKGAWIMRNSWGLTNKAGNPCGDNGYYYISYQDTSLNATGVYIAELDSKRYTRVDTLSPLGPISANYKIPFFENGSLSFANKLTSSASQMLKAVGIYVPADGMSYTLGIRLKGTSPENGSEVYTQSGTFGQNGLASYKGYRTIDLAKFVYLPSKEDYVVTVTLKNQDGSPITYVLSFND